MIKISVVILAYNVEKYIDRCIQSILNQNNKFFELIIINDGSTDGTKEKINKYANNREVSIINKENSGVNNCRKLGLDLAKGKYVLFVDGDDWLEKDSIKILRNKITDDSDVIVFNANIAFENNKKEPLKCYLGDKQDYIKDIMVDKFKPTFWCKLYKVEFLKKNHIKFYNLNYAEDLCTNIDVLISNPKITVIDDVIYNYYQRAGSLTKGSIKKRKDIMISIDNIYSSLIKKQYYEKYKDAYEYLIYYHLFYNILIRTKEWDAHAYELYSFFKDKNIKCLKNHYIRKHILSQNTPLVLKILIFNFNSRLGIEYEKIREKLVNIKIGE